MRHSVNGAAMTVSTAGAIFRDSAFTKTARRPPNSGTVWASSTKREGLVASSSPSIRTNVKGSAGSSTDARIRPEHKHDRLITVRSGYEAVDVGSFDGSHLLVIAWWAGAKGYA